jgi:hypothetical protein
MAMILKRGSYFEFEEETLHSITKPECANIPINSRESNETLKDCESQLQKDKPSFRILLGI